ncbi:hypothetical protein ALC56_05914 [Trachymyrmex septentrionalis]|uniref:Uncharacterized protein n=1 Tax=Trachymyrmex septentrionalis TaxID=34720 RepID=A0A195FGB2_9HYME|nr:hypothetical protein ALC56_05914 [Trachymyrmex septentrionalis]
MHQRLYFISKPVLPICESPLTASKLKTVQVFRPNVSRRTMQSKGWNKAVPYNESETDLLVFKSRSIMEFYYNHSSQVYLNKKYGRYGKMFEIKLHQFEYICPCACMMSQILSIHEFHGIGYTLYIYILRVWLHIMYTRYTY